MKKSILSIVILFMCIHSYAQVRLPRLISNGIVLQRDQAINIWGWASANGHVQLTLDNEVYQTQANTNGDWSISIKAHTAGGPHTMNIKASNEIHLNDILFGDVWVCSGQSNMELWMGRLKYKYADEISKANNTFIRQCY